MMGHIIKVYFNDNLNKNLEKQFLAVKKYLNNTFTEDALKYSEENGCFSATIGDLSIDQCGLRKGWLGFFNQENDEKVNLEMLDGNFFLYEVDDHQIKIVTDYTASKSVFYYASRDFLIFATLQIPIVKFLGGFEFNRNNVRWMVSSGITAPFQSWDKRVLMLGPKNVLCYNRSKGTVLIREYKIKRNGYKDDLSSFEDAIKNGLLSSKSSNRTASHLLSGGLDSRLLLFLKAIPEELSCITWGILSKTNKSSDVGVANRLKELFNLELKFYPIPSSSENCKYVVKNFLNFSEGRIDQISGYTDGFNLWRGIKEDGITEIIRGDEAFSLFNERNEVLIRKRNGISLAEDYEGDLVKLFTESKSPTLEEFVKKEGESLNEYAKRLRLQYRLPLILAPLNSIKSVFVEVNNPLLNNSIVDFAEFLSPEVDYRRKNFPTINSRYCNLGYAKSVSIENLKLLLDKYFREYLVGELKGISQSVWKDVGLKDEEVSKLLQKMSNPYSSKVTKFWKIKKMVPKSIKLFFLPMKKNTLSDILIVWRLYIIVFFYLKLDCK